jgi:short-subunit dehydrogenase
MSQSGRIVVLTGASAGVGRAIARKLGQRGSRVTLIARGRERLEQTAGEIEANGGTALICGGDVADPSVHERAANETEQTFGPIDAWINCAMTSVFSPVSEMVPDEYLRVTEVTYLGYVYGTLAALKRMRTRNAGVILQVGSALAHRSIPLQSAYCAAKHAVWGFTTSLRSELIGESSAIRVTMVQLPAMNTPQFDWVKSRLPRRAQPWPPIFEPEVGADGVLYALDNDCGRELLVAWPTVKAVLGNKVVPAHLDRFLGENGFDAQQTTEPEDPYRLDNLWQPVPSEFAARGRFTDRSTDHSTELVLRRNREWLALAAAGALGLALGLRKTGVDGTSDTRPLARTDAHSEASPG